MNRNTIGSAGFCCFAVLRKWGWCSSGSQFHEALLCNQEKLRWACKLLKPSFFIQVVFYATNQKKLHTNYGGLLMCNFCTSEWWSATSNEIATECGELRSPLRDLWCCCSVLAACARGVLIENDSIPPRASNGDDLFHLSYLHILFHGHSCRVFTQIPPRLAAYTRSICIKRITKPRILGRWNKTHLIFVFPEIVLHEIICILLTIKNIYWEIEATATDKQFWGTCTAVWWLVPFLDGELLAGISKRQYYSSKNAEKDKRWILKL